MIPPLFARMSRQRLEDEPHGLPVTFPLYVSDGKPRTARIRVELDLADLRLLDIALSVLETHQAQSLRARLTAARDNLDR